MFHQIKISSLLGLSCVMKSINIGACPMDLQNSERE